MTHLLRLASKRTHAVGAVLAVVLLAASGATIPPTAVAAAEAAPPVAAGTPTLNLQNGQNLEGTVSVEAEPTVEDDSVVSISVDGHAVAADQTAGTAHVNFDMGGNGTEARYRNYITVNDHTSEADRVYFPDISGDRTGTLDFPGAWLRSGDNTITVHAGWAWVDTTNTGAVGYEQLPNGEGGRCPNYDDFSLSSISTSLLGVVVDGEQNAFSYSFGDGTCGSSPRLLTQELTFVVSGEPGDTAGMSADLDTTTLSNGTHTISATTKSGAAASVTVEVNNAPPGSAKVTPAEGALVHLTQSVIAALPPGSIDFVAGINPSTVTADCPTGNFDDFLMRDFELLPAGAKATQLTKEIAETTVTVGSASYPPGAQVAIFIGDGTCGSTYVNTLRKEILFEVTAEDGSALPAKGLRADVDTTTLDDGQHIITAVSGGKTATRRFTVDNTAPVVESSVPAEGQRLTSTVALIVEVRDATGVAGTPTITLDGAPVRQGDPIGHGLPAGAHTIAVTAADTLGNTATREVHFSSASIPDVPTELGASVTGVNTVSARLSAKVPGEDGVPLTATFTKADVVLPSSGYQGVATAVPTRLDVAYDEKVDVGSLRPLDGKTIDTTSSRDVVFQRYDIPLGAAQKEPTLRWEGTIDPARVVALRVWDPAAKKWVVLTSSRGQAQGSTVLTAPLADGYRDRDTVHVLVTGEDPFADDLSPRDSSAQDDKDHFEDPNSYDFAIAHFTDTQYLSESAAGGTYDDWDGIAEPSDIETAEEQAIWAAAYRAETQWIADNAPGRKIEYTAHTGDIIENDYYDPLAKNPDGSLQRPGLDAQVDREFDVSSNFQKVLDDNGVVNQVIAGNHDNQLGAETGASSRFSKTFSAGRYYQVAKTWPPRTEYHAWDEKTNANGSVTPGEDNQNSYVLFSAGGLDFVAVGLSYGVTQQEAKWADSIFKRYKDRNGILLSHDYLRPSTNPDGRGAGFSAPDGSPLYKQVVENNPNVFLVLAGHEHGVGTNLKTNIGVTVTHDVVELLADYQFYTVAAGELWPNLVDGNGNIDLNGDGTPDHKSTDRLQFGASFLRLLQFDVDRAEMHIDTYSPFLNDFGATEYDIRQDGSQTTPRYNGAEDNLTLPVDLTTRVTSFSTDSLAAYVPSGVIDTDDLTANGTATTTWNGLLPGTSYAWIVAATTADDGVAVAQPAVFRTAKGEPVVTATAAPADWGTAAKVTVTVAADAAPVTGTVELREGTTVRGSAELSGGTLTFPLPVGLAAGSHTLTASYSGSDTLHPAEGSVTVTVNLPPGWNAAAQYQAGDKVSYDGRPYLASWTTRNQAPGAATGPWQELAMTEDGVTVWTASRIFNAGDVVVYQDKTFRARWYTRDQAPGSPTGPWEELAPTPPDNSPAAWTPTTVYNASDRVSYQGHVYEARWYTRNQPPGDPAGPWTLIS